MLDVNAPAAPGIWIVFFATLAIYLLLGVASITILRQLAKIPLSTSDAQKDDHGTR